MATHLIGSDGSISMPDGYFAAINTFSCTLTRASQIVTGFGDTGQRRRLSSVLDITGSIGGTPVKDQGDSNPFGIANSGGVTGTDSLTLTLKFAESGATDCTLAFGAVVNSVAMSATQDGAQTVTFNFEMNDNDGPTVSWDES